MTAKNNSRPLSVSLVLNTGLTVMELVIGLASGSLALVSDGMRNLTDSITLTIALIAERLSERQSDDQKTFGYGRVKIVASLINTGVLFAVAIFILYQAVHRIDHPQSVSGVTIAAVAMVGTLVNGTSAVLLHKQRKDLNIGSTYTGLLYGAFGSVGIIVSGILISALHWYFVDTLAGIVIAMLLLFATLKLTRDALHILLEGVPETVDVHDIRRTLLALDGVQGIREMHAWTIAHDNYAFSSQLIIAPAYQHESHTIVDNVKSLLHKEYGFHHTTIEVKLGE